MNQYQSIRIFKGIGEKRFQAFQRLGISTVFDLITYFPRRYEDRSVIKPVGDLINDEAVCIDTTIASEPTLARIRRGLEIVKFRAFDETGTIDISYFNQSYIRTQFHKGDHFRFYGKVQIRNKRVSMTNPVADPADNDTHKTGHITPIYRSTTGLTQNNIRSAVEQALDIIDQIPDILPDTILQQYDLCSSSLAFRQIHAPENYTMLESARKRFIFEEFFRLCTSMRFLNSKRNTKSGIIMKDVNNELFIQNLPYIPTNAQFRAFHDIRSDLISGSVMNRLIQGDVGCGKTLIAAFASWFACQNSFQVVLMAPTEILAEQHFRTFTSILKPYGIRTGLLTGSVSSTERTCTRELIAEGKLDFIVGTHALFSDDITYPNLGLVITDEQHRFGVEQRNRLISKASNPHILVMSATPIPRTLALMIYGDLDVSIIDEMPPGRSVVETFAVNSSYRQRINNFIKKTIDDSHQVYIVCPAIDENESFPLTTVEEHTKLLKKAIPSARIESIHGKMKEQEKDNIMKSFSDGEIDVLVSTTVIEVGVDVPNATLMIIEDADRFGLSQLHQLRGRVGRGKSQSYCILISDTDNDLAQTRLKLMTKTHSGFEIAEQDLAMRGPGDFFGNRQHGLPPIRIADLCSDMQLLQEAQTAAIEIMEQDPDLSLPEHYELKKYINQNAMLSMGFMN